MLYAFTDIKNYPLGEMTVSVNVRLTIADSGENAYSFTIKITVLDCLTEPFTFGNIPVKDDLQHSLKFPSFSRTLKFVETITFTSSDAQQFCKIWEYRITCTDNQQDLNKSYPTVYTIPKYTPKSTIY